MKKRMKANTKSLLAISMKPGLSGVKVRSTRSLMRRLMYPLIPLDKSPTKRAKTRNPKVFLYTLFILHPRKIFFHGFQGDAAVDDFYDVIIFFSDAFIESVRDGNNRRVQ